MMLVGENPGKYIHKFSSQFKRDFMQLLRTSHGEKKVYINHFYQEYIRDKEHVHMNSTHWSSLTEFAKYLGREGICRVEEGERGLQIQWIDDSPEAIKRREDIKNKDRQAKGDEDLESRLLEQQIRKAKEKEKAESTPALPVQAAPSLAPVDDAPPVKVSFALGGGSKQSKPPPPPNDAPAQPQPSDVAANDTTTAASDNAIAPVEASAATVPATKISFGLGGAKPKVSPFAKKDPFAKQKVRTPAVPEKKMSNAERIMREEIERKRQRDERGSNNGYKRARYD